MRMREEVLMRHLNQVQEGSVLRLRLVAQRFAVGRLEYGFSTPEERCAP